MTVDTTFDFRSDSPKGDPDKYSPTLHRYHQLLWSKPLPSGAPFIAVIRVFQPMITMPPR